MTVQKYLPEIKKILLASLPHAKAFLFGSSVRNATFHDIDIGITGAKDSELSSLKEALYEAPIPFKVDIVNFDTADKTFTDYVTRNEKLVWIQ